jgi:hypothetical protein
MSHYDICHRVTYDTRQGGVWAYLAKLNTCPYTTQLDL